MDLLQYVEYKHIINLVSSHRNYHESHDLGLDNRKNEIKDKSVDLLHYKV